MQNEYKSQLGDLEVNLSTQGATLVRRESEIKMMREHVSSIQLTFAYFSGNHQFHYIVLIYREFIND